MRPILTVPGLSGSGPDHWQSHWERADPCFQRVEQENWDAPDLQAWSDRLAVAIAARPGSVLVGHSLACALIAHVAGRDPPLPIGGALLVAPTDIDSETHCPPEARGFAPMPTWRLPFPAIVVASTNDAYLDLPRGRFFADAWGAEVTVLEGAGHINTAAGFGPWPEGRRILDRLLARLDAAAAGPVHF